MKSEQPVPLPAMQIEPVRIEQRGPLLLAGLKDRFTGETIPQIPLLWQRFGPHIGALPNEVDGVAYGLCLPSSEDEASFDYMAAVEVTTFSNLPSGLERLRVPAATYAIFEHVGHVSKLSWTVDAIQREWLPRSGRKPPSDAAGLPAFFERYGPRFDPQKGEGDVEVWLPIRE